MPRRVPYAAQIINYLVMQISNYLDIPCQSALREARTVWSGVYLGTGRGEVLRTQRNETAFLHETWSIKGEATKAG
jgi:hypothetical protein